MEKLSVFAAVVLAVSVFAVEQPTPPIPPTSPSTPSDSYFRSNVIFEDDFAIPTEGRRDPFTITKLSEIPVIPGYAPPPPPPPRKDTFEKTREAIESALRQGESSLMELDAFSTIQFCDAGVVQLPAIDFAEHPEFEQLKGSLLRLRKAADQLQRRQSAERDFAAMNIKVQGVMVNPKRPLAIVNSKTVRKGETIHLDNNESLLIDEVQPERVIFAFRGYRMTLSLAETGK